MKTIAIVNTFNRPQHHALQVQAIKDQTLPPDEIYCVCNKPTMNVVDFEKQAGVEYADLSWNSKFHTRFFIALGIACDYVAVFDCDTIPGSEWLQNCWDHRDLGILGGAGVRVLGPQYHPNKIYGWCGVKSDVPERVDLVGHAWFMSKDHLRVLATEEPMTYDNGEDIQLGFLAEKNGIRHWVPPHTKDNQRRWACLPQYGKLGTTGAATWRRNKRRGETHHQVRDKLVAKYRERGWVMAKDE